MGASRESRAILPDVLLSRLSFYRDADSRERVAPAILVVA